MITVSVQISDEEKKALEWDIVDLQEWANNALHDKARKCADEIIKLALEDKTHTILSIEDKQLLRTYFDNQGIIIPPPIQQFPNNIKAEIVKRANIQSAAERNATGPTGPE